jgi:hypothetical protein
MFRFSIRELMLVTLVVGLVAGWLLDRHEDRREMNLWKQRATAFQHVLVEDGWKIEWRPQKDAVIITKPGNKIGEDHGYNLKQEICDCGPSVSF